MKATTPSNTGLSNREDVANGASYLHMMEKLLRIRQCCDHYYLVLLAKFASGIPDSELTPKTLNELFDELIEAIREKEIAENPSAAEKQNSNKDIDWKKTCPVCLCRPTSKEESAMLSCLHPLCKSCAESMCSKSTTDPQVYLCPFCKTGSGHSLLSKDPGFLLQFPIPSSTTLLTNAFCRIVLFGDR